MVENLLDAELFLPPIMDVNSSEAVLEPPPTMDEK